MKTKTQTDKEKEYTIVKVKTEFIRGLKILAAMEGKDMQDVISDAVREYLKDKNIPRLN